MFNGSAATHVRQSDSFNSNFHLPLRSVLNPIAKNYENRSISFIITEENKKAQLTQRERATAVHV